MTPNWPKSAKKRPNAAGRGVSNFLYAHVFSSEKLCETDHIQFLGIDMAIGKLPKEGSLVEAVWIDAVGYIGSDLSEAKPAMCKTIGRLMAVNGQSIVLATSLYEDGSGDFTVLPKGMITEPLRKIE
jgi:hypothetical protein